jgi:hypothetical protein
LKREKRKRKWTKGKRKGGKSKEKIIKSEKLAEIYTKRARKAK